MDEFYLTCRWLNQYLGAIAAMCVMWRLVPLVLDRPRWFEAAPRHRILVFLVLAGFELSSAYGAVVTVNGPASWISCVFTVLHAATIALCVWWPHPPRHQPGDS